jgi:hypothetical protein
VQSTYGCKTWPFTLREEHKRGVLDNRVLRKIFGPETRVGQKIDKKKLDEHQCCYGEVGRGGVFTNY